MGPENGTPSGSSVSGRTSADASGVRPLSESTEAKRKRDSRAARKHGSATSGRPGGEPTAKGNPSGFDGVLGHAGGTISPGEATEQLFWGHVGLAKAIRSDIDLHDLDEEFEVAGKNYAYVANNLWPPMRLVIRFIAPIVLVAVLVVIWGHMIAATPWIHRVRDWWSRRGERSVDAPAPAPASNASSAAPPHPATVAYGVVPPIQQQKPAEEPPPIPRRPTIGRGIGGHRL